MSATSVISAIAAALSSVSALKRVYVHAPASAPTAHLPCAVILHAGTQARQHAAGMRRLEHVFNVLLAVAPTAQDTPAVRHAQAMQVHDAVMDALSADFALGGAVDHIAEIRSDGAGVVTIAGVEHIGYEIRITVIEKGA